MGKSGGFGWVGRLRDGAAHNQEARALAQGIDTLPQADPGLRAQFDARAAHHAGFAAFHVLKAPGTLEWRNRPSL